jgi:putative FmdB family regulatory protein
MPTYRYRCEKCGEQFELWQSIHDDALEEHPGCGGRVAKVLAPAGIVLKGSGFYRTDSRSSSRGSRDGDRSEKKETAGTSGANGSGSKDAAKDTSKSSPSSGSSSSGSAASSTPSKKDGS